MKIYKGIGLMSGTSLDGVDIAFCEFQEKNGQWNYTILKAETIPFEEVWTARLLFLHEQNAETYAKTNVYFGHYLGKIVSEFIAKHQLNPDFIASHGQTIFHQPEKNFTAQIGDGETMASYFNCPLVSNFRNKDVALGGQGAPLVPFGEKFLFPDFNIFLNLGGIANITIGNIAFDITPCNMALNHITLKEAGIPFDTEGKIAASGKINNDLFLAITDHDFYLKEPPKSLGKEWFERNMLEHLININIHLEDKLHTLCKHISTKVKEALLRNKTESKTVLATGGGVHNIFLKEQLSKELNINGFDLVVPDKNTIDYKEALIFAFLGLTVLLGRPNVLSTVTGSSQNNLGGSIHLPASGSKHTGFL